MRKDLKKLDKQKIFATATFVRYGNSYNKTRGNQRLDEKSYRLLFRDIIVKGNTDIFVGHMWFAHVKGFKVLGLMEKGDKVKIFGTVRKYTKKDKDKDQISDYEILPIRIERL